MNARQYAISKHKETNHLYDGKPYEVHLIDVVTIANEYLHLIPEGWRELVLDACWCHDLIEDCRETWNDVARATNASVAEIVYALTNEKGRSRAERANDNYYNGIRKTEFSTFVKLCDRISNIQYSKRTGSSMFNKYCLEKKEFTEKLYDEKYKEMFEQLNSICK